MILNLFVVLILYEKSIRVSESNMADILFYEATEFEENYNNKVKFLKK